jgi:hypothetical protein
MYAVITWLESQQWPFITWEVTIPRGLIRGRVDVAAASKGFRQSVAVEVKAAYVPENPEGQLFDAQRAAEYVYIAAPPDVLCMIEIPASVGILEARSDGSRTIVIAKRPAKRGKPQREARKDYLHSLIRAAARRSTLESALVAKSVCPACMSNHCPFWRVPVDIEEVEIDSEDIS